MISPEALEKARSLVANYGSDPDGLLVGAIAAALQAERDAAAPKLPDDLAGLVRLLKALATDHECNDEMDAASTCDQAATAIQSLVARNAELETGLRGLLDCPDIADNDYKDEETHAAERRARSLLNKDRQP